ncbi:MAG TPA: glycosyl hydrolase, partial [Gemmatimonadaceae bacterium]|nr:glycosyl hydrolase [Gemmatimonadaceae bacterium]
MRFSRLSLATTAIISLVGFSARASAQRPSDSLEIGFRDPPASARPRTWWHWTASNVTKEGITKDLEWMKRVGIAGVQLADVAAGGGQTVEKKIVFGTPEWLDAVRHAAAEADRLGLEMDLFASPGWSLTGGPWVKPAQAMKKLVWSETILRGPRRLSMRLPQPPS